LKKTGVFMVIRKKLLKNVRPFYEAFDLVKVIIGIRRAGKSVFLMQIANELKGMGVKEHQIIFMNFELFEFSHIRTAQDLNKDIKRRIKKSRSKFYIFLDEIQNVEQFELVVNSLRAQGNASIFITGSNAHLLSGELATHLSGRYVTFLLTPFTFAEVLEITKERNKKIAFDNYMLWGGLPGRFAFTGENEVQKYLQDVFDSTILRDIIMRTKIRDLNLLDNIIQFLLDNIGNIFSANTVSKYLKSQSRNVSAETLYNHINHIVSSLIFSKVNRYDVKGKNIFSTLEKYYIADMGFLQLKRSRLNENLAARLENIVANELIARGYKINVGVMPNAEIDFVATKNNKTQYIQVCYKIDSDKTLKRELNAFKGIPEKKLLITTDTYDYSQNGVECVNVVEWL
jgi:predicted AAA+ superfamily ATPase